MATSSRKKHATAIEADSGRQVIARAAAVLRTLEGAPLGLSIADITRASGLPRTTVTRLVASLAAEQLVAVHDRAVRLGPALMRLAAAVHRDAAALARPHMQKLSRDLRETVDLWVEREGFIELVEEVASDQEVRIVAAPGFRLPLHTTASGKAFLAQRNDEDIRQRVSRTGLPALTPRTLISIDALLAEIARIRSTGIAIDIEEHAPDICAAGMVVDLGLPECYALTVPAPAKRFQASKRDVEAALRDCVRTLEGRKGGSGGTTPSAISRARC